MTSKISTLRVHLMAASAVLSSLAGAAHAADAVEADGGAKAVSEVVVTIAKTTVTNLNDIKGVSTAVVTGNSGGYTAFPLAPRMAFVTLDASF